MKTVKRNINNKKHILKKYSKKTTAKKIYKKKVGGGKGNASSNSKTLSQQLPRTLRTNQQLERELRAKKRASKQSETRIAPNQPLTLKRSIRIENKKPLLLPFPLPVPLPFPNTIHSGGWLEFLKEGNVSSSQETLPSLSSTLSASIVRTSTPTKQPNTLNAIPNTPHRVENIKISNVIIGTTQTPFPIYSGTPDTTSVIIGASLPTFSEMIVNYLKYKEIQINEKKLSDNLKNYILSKLKNNDKTNNHLFYLISSQNNFIDNTNYYIYFIGLLQTRGFRIYNNNINTISTFVESSFTTSSSSSFSRPNFVEFMIKLLPSLDDTDIAYLRSHLRIAFSGDSLAETTKVASAIRGEEYISSFKQNEKTGIQCNDEKNWIIKCIENRGNNFVNRYNERNKDWERINNEEIEYILKKQKYNIYKAPCGTCWICRNPIYHYYIILTGNIDIKKNRIYLNSKCGEDEHVLPPSVGDIVGVLNMDPQISHWTMAQYGKETLYSYGLNPSHAFCNQLKSDFLFYGLIKLNIPNDTNRKKIIEDLWKAQVTSWFAAERYHSLENIAQIISDGATNLFGNGRTVKKLDQIADLYYSKTVPIIETYINQNIAPRLLQQSDRGSSNIGNMLQLKTLMYVSQICLATCPSFVQKWEMFYSR
jgi:hypothetical protein